MPNPSQPTPPLARAAASPRQLPEASRNKGPTGIGGDILASGLSSASLGYKSVGPGAAVRLDPIAGGLVQPRRPGRKSIVVAMRKQARQQVYGSEVPGSAGSASTGGRALAGRGGTVAQYLSELRSHEKATRLAADVANPRLMSPSKPLPPMPSTPGASEAHKLPSPPLFGSAPLPLLAPPSPGMQPTYGLLSPRHQPPLSPWQQSLLGPRQQSRSQAVPSSAPVFASAESLPDFSSDLRPLPRKSILRKSSTGAHRSPRTSRSRPSPYGVPAAAPAVRCAQRNNSVARKTNAHVIPSHRASIFFAAQLDDGDEEEFAPLGEDIVHLGDVPRRSEFVHAPRGHSVAGSVPRQSMVIGGADSGKGLMFFFDEGANI